MCVCECVSDARGFGPSWVANVEFDLALRDLARPVVRQAHLLPLCVGGWVDGCVCGRAGVWVKVSVCVYVCVCGCCVQVRVRVFVRVYICVCAKRTCTHAHMANVKKGKTKARN